MGLEDVSQVPLAPGLDQSHLEDLLADAPDDVRFHLSRGAAESFVHTVPLLHPRGYLQVQDIFVADMHEYRQGFRGPGKLDGSVVNWVNGALLRADRREDGVRRALRAVPIPRPARARRSSTRHHATERHQA